MYGCHWWPNPRHPHREMPGYLRFASAILLFVERRVVVVVVKRMKNGPPRERKQRKYAFSSAFFSAPFFCRACWTLLGLEEECPFRCFVVFDEGLSHANIMHGVVLSSENASHSMPGISERFHLQVADLNSPTQSPMSTYRC